MLLLKISDNCQENTSAGASLWITISLSSWPATMFIKKDPPAQVFSCECSETFLRTPILQSSNKCMENLDLARHCSEAAVHRFSSK